MIVIIYIYVYIITSCIYSICANTQFYNNNNNRPIYTVNRLKDFTDVSNGTLRKDPPTKIPKKTRLNNNTHKTTPDRLPRGPKRRCSSHTSPHIPYPCLPRPSSDPIHHAVVKRRDPPLQGAVYFQAASADHDCYGAWR